MSTTNKSKGKSARYYASAPRALAKKRAYNRKYKKGVGNPKADKQAKDRAKNWTKRRQLRRKGVNMAGKDLAHTKNGTLRLKDSSKNRGSKSDRPGDRKARGKGNKKKKTTSKKK